MKTPAFEIKVNGRPVASILNERLISLTITDKEGVSSDSICVELNDGHPFADIPKKGDIIEVSLGYLETGVVSFGTFTVDDPEVRCLPYSLTINGRGANVRDQFKQQRSRHWDRKTVKDIVTQIADENGLTPIIDAEVASHEYDWFGQQNESDMHVVERLARRHGALFSVKDGKLVFVKKGSGKSASGKELTPVVVGPFEIIEGTCRINFAYRKKHRKVKAKSRSRKKAKTETVEADSDEEGTADYTLPDAYADEAEAKKAAKSKAESLQSETVRTSVSVFGDPTVRAGAPFNYTGVRPEVDDLQFIIETATHKLTKAGYNTDIEAKLKPNGDSKVLDKAKGNKPSKPAKNTAPVPTVPTPTSPLKPNVSGLGQVGIGRA